MRSERPDVARTPFVVAGGRYAIGPCICIVDVCVCRVEACRRGCAGARRSVRPAASKNCFSHRHAHGPSSFAALRPARRDAADAYRTHGRGRPARRAPPAGPPPAPERHAQECRTPPKHQTPAPWRPGQIPLSIAPPSLSRSARTTRMRNTVPQKHSRWVTSLHAPRHTRRTCEPRVSPTPRENIPAPPHRAPHLVLAPAHPRRPLST